MHLEKDQPHIPRAIGWKIRVLLKEASPEATIGAPGEQPHPDMFICPFYGDDLNLTIPLTDGYIRGANFATCSRAICIGDEVHELELPAYARKGPIRSTNTSGRRPKEPKAGQPTALD